MLSKNIDRFKKSKLEYKTSSSLSEGFNQKAKDDERFDDDLLPDSDGE